MPAIDPDDEPTKPDATGSSSALMVARLFDQLPPIDQKRISKIIEIWFTADLGDRILIEEMVMRIPRGPAR